MVPPSYANDQVLAFYEALPFGHRETAAAQIAAIRRRNVVDAYPPFRSLLDERTRVLDVGCGTGTLAISIAYHHRCRVEGIDFNAVAVARAREVATGLGVEAAFLVADLFSYRPREPFDVVTCLGVLHHTNDCLKGLQTLCERFVAPGGHAFIGLYHVFGRRAFRDYFEGLKRRGASEEELLARYRELDSRFVDEVLLRSWFRDQVLHPHESHHTLAEVLPVLERCSMELVSTSINRFAPIASLDRLLESEPDLEPLGGDMLRRKHYYPGFFVFLVRKRPGRETGRDGDPRGAQWTGSSSR